MVVVSIRICDGSRENPDQAIVVEDGLISGSPWVQDGESSWSHLLWLLQERILSLLTREGPAFMATVISTQHREGRASLSIAVIWPLARSPYLGLVVSV